MIQIIHLKILYQVTFVFLLKNQTLWLIIKQTIKLKMKLVVTFDVIN